MMNINEFLPLGSIVKVEKIDKEVMIIGYMGYTTDSNPESRDYIGVESIDGFSDETMILFNKESIENVLFIGYKNNKVTNMLKALDGFNEDLKNSNNFDEMQKKTANRNIKNKTSSSVSTKTKSKVSEIVNIPSKDETENVGE